MIRDVASRYKSDLIILFDDIPPLEWDKVNSSLVVYSHFPYAALLSQAKIIVHAKGIEPFGIAVAEGMVAGAIPVVYKGPASGPWIDVVDKGRYGIGFRTTEELAEAIEHVINTERELFELQNKARERSRIFLLNVFEKRFMELIEGTI